MGIRFEGNVLIQSITWTVLSWENVREMICNKQIKDMINRKDKEALKKVIRELAKDVDIDDGVDIDRIIDDLADDMINASGDVVIATSYEHIDTLIDLFEVFIDKYIYDK